MDVVTSRLSEIEAATRTIVEETNARKKAFAEEMDAKTAAFDKSVEQETVHRIVEIQGKVEADMGRPLVKQKAESEALFEELEDSYNRRHEGYIEALLRKMTEG